MKTIIAGSRNLGRKEVDMAMLRASWWPTEVVGGKARGVDDAGEAWARDNNVPFAGFPADWSKFGKAAGYRRNEEMGLYADALVAVWDGISRGTKHMIDIARNMGLTVFVYIPTLDSPPQSIVN